MLALHGWRRDHRDFDAVLTGGSLAAVALDLPGFGSTPAPESAWGSVEYAEVVSAVLDEMQPRVIVVGHSFGGRVAVRLAASYPERVGGLVLTAAPLHRSRDAARPRMRLRWARQLARTGLIRAEKLEALRQRYGSEDYRAATGVMRAVLVRTLREDYSDSLRGIRCPVELVWGDDDSEVPVAVARQLAHELPVSNLVVCPGAGHLTPLTVPGELRAAIERLGS